MKRREIGCLAVFFLLLAGAVVWVLSPSAEDNAAARFLSHMGGYLTLWQQIETGASTVPIDDSEPYIAGRAVVIDVRSEELDPLFFALPEALRATDPVEVATVIFIRCEREKVGEYGQFADAYAQSCELWVVDRTAPKVVLTFGARSQPAGEVRFPYWDRTAPRPIEEMVARIKGLPIR